MKILLLICFLLNSSELLANELKDNINDYRFYQTSDNKFNRHFKTDLAYLKYTDPCIFIKSYEMDNAIRICDMKGSGLDLERDSNSINFLKPSLDSGYFKFNLENKGMTFFCSIDLVDMTVAFKS